MKNSISFILIAQMDIRDTRVATFFNFNSPFPSFHTFTAIKSLRGRLYVILLTSDPIHSLCLTPLRSSTFIKGAILFKYQGAVCGKKVCGYQPDKESSRAGCPPWREVVYLGDLIKSAANSMDVSRATNELRSPSAHRISRHVARTATARLRSLYRVHEYASN